MADNTAEVESPDVDVEDVSLIDNQIAPKTDAPSEPADEGKEDAAATEDKPAEDAKPETSEGEQSPEKPQETAPDETEQKRANEAAAARRVQERARTRNQVAQQLDQTYGPKTEDQLVEEGLSRQDAQIQALREEMQYQQQRTHIAEMNAGLQTEAVNVYNDFPVFNPESKDYDADFAQMVERQYATSARLQTDENGIVLNAEVPLYDFYQSMATIYNRGQSKGNQTAQADALEMLARTENVGGSSSTSGNSSDELSDLEERLADTVIT
jgi:hypothetical protein